MSPCPFPTTITITPRAPPPLIDIFWWTRPEIKIFHVGPRPGYEYFNGDSSEIQKDFLAPDFYLNCWGFF